MKPTYTVFLRTLSHSWCQMGHFLCLLAIFFYVEEGLYLSGFECLLSHVILVIVSVFIWMCLFGEISVLANYLDPCGLGFSSARTDVEGITLVVTELRML